MRNLTEEAVKDQNRPNLRLVGRPSAGANKRFATSQMVTIFSPRFMKCSLDIFFNHALPQNLNLLNYFVINIYNQHFKNN